MSTVSLKLHFAAGHRILGLEGAGAKCQTPHGHTFTVTWTFRQDGTTWPPPVEYGNAKATLRALVKTKFDHAFFVDTDDEFLEWLRLRGLKYYAMNGVPSTEAMAAEIASQTQQVLPEGDLIEVRLEEGPENTACWRPRAKALDFDAYQTLANGGCSGA